LPTIWNTENFTKVKEEKDMANEYKDYRDLMMRAEIEDRQITVQTVVLDTGMNPEEFRNLMKDIADALRIADSASYKEYEQAKLDYANAEEKEDVKNAEWKKDRLFKRWDKVSNLLEFFKAMSEFGEGEKETEDGDND
jgi:hypothetical protein